MTRRGAFRRLVCHVQMKHRLILGSCLLLLVGCSSITLVYNRIDWFAPFYVDDYVSLSRAQRSLLKRELVELRDWHCGTQLNHYARWASAVEGDIVEQRLSPRLVAARYDEVRVALRQVVSAATPGTAELFLTLSPEQHDELFRRLERENDEFNATYVDVPLPKAQEAYSARMQKQLSEWIGSLTSEQEHRVRAWSERVAPGAADRLLARRAWQAELRRLLSQPSDRLGFEQELRTLLVHPDGVRPERYQAVRDAYRSEMVALLGDIATLLTPKQKDRLLSQARSWRRDFERMACKAPASSAGNEPANTPVGESGGLSKIMSLISVG